MKIRSRTYRGALAGLLAIACTLIPTGALNAQSSSLSARFDLDRKRMYIHDTATATVTITAVGVRLGSGFEVNKLPDQAILRRGEAAEYPATRTMENGVLNESRIFKFPLTAMTNGTVEIAPVIRVSVVAPQLNFFGNPFQERIVEVAATPVNLELIPLPEAGRPQAFSQCVGSFDFQVEMDPTDVAIGELITATMRISGTGYVDGITAPASSPGMNFKVYESRQIPVRDGKGVAFQQIIIPQSDSATLIPPVTFSFFDPGEGKYKTISRGPFPLRIHAPKQAPAGQAPANTSPATNSQGSITGAPSFIGTPMTSDQAAALVARRMLHGPLMILLGALLIAYPVALLGFRKLWEKRRSSGRLTKTVTALIAAAVVLALTFAIYRTAIRIVSSGAMAVVAVSAKARFAPSETAQESFNLSPGSSVEIYAIHESWARIDSNGRLGWIQVKALTSPGQNP